MSMSTHRAVSASVFKSRCLKMLDRVAHTGESLIVTKRGRPVARIVPMAPAGGSSLKHSVSVHGDIVGPLLDDWELGR
ncbi:MAG: type II toxin-antitoxin system Phd/YefM family antitoxin [Acidobacteria bacterium]|nr:type II toxin-antitoxin system Phd/YefM family antitoxin [Acidobacteriota bacterium]